MVALEADDRVVELVLILDHLVGVLGLQGERPRGAAPHREVLVDVDRPARLLGAEARNRREIGADLDERNGELLDPAHRNVDLAEPAHADLGEPSSRQVPARSADAAVNDACAVVELVRDGIELLGVFEEFLKNIQCQFVHAEHVENLIRVQTAGELIRIMKSSAPAPGAPARARDRTGD